MKIGNLGGSVIAWQRGYSLWRVDLFARTYWGQRETRMWLGHLLIGFLWPFGRETSPRLDALQRGIAVWLGRPVSPSEAIDFAAKLPNPEGR